MGYVKAKMGDFKGTVSSLNKAIELDPQSELAYKLRGQAKFELKDYKGAKSDFEKALELNPNDKEAKEMLSKIK